MIEKGFEFRFVIKEKFVRIVNKRFYLNVIKFYVFLVGFNDRVEIEERIKSLIENVD